MITLLTLTLLAATITPPSESVEFRQPQLSAAQGQVVVAFGAGKAIYVASSTDQGRTFSTPVKVAEAGALALGRHRGPRVTILPDAWVLTAVIGETVDTGAHAHGLPAAGDLTVWRSSDQGRTWDRTGIINDQRGAAREGLHAIAAARDGSLAAVWLDLRSGKTQLYGSRSTDGGKTWSANTLVYASPSGTICECCAPSLMHDGRQWWTMWRNALNGSRDMFLARSTDGAKFTDPHRSGRGTWKIEACPMGGGGLAMDEGSPISAWRRESSVYLTREGEQERLMGQGHDVAIAAGRKGVYVAWTAEKGIALMRPGARTSEIINSTGGFVSLAALEDGTILAAWEDGGAIHTLRVTE